MRAYVCLLLLFFVFFIHIIITIIIFIIIFVKILYLKKELNKQEIVEGLTTPTNKQPNNNNISKTL